MPLFVAKHQHKAEACPAGDPQMGPMLAQYVSAPSVQEHGLTLHGEAVIDGAHTLYLILDAPGPEQVDQFMTPFSQVGTVEVLPASRCEQVVARAAC